MWLYLSYIIFIVLFYYIFIFISVVLIYIIFLKCNFFFLLFFHNSPYNKICIMIFGKVYMVYIITINTSESLRKTLSILYTVKFSRMSLNMLLNNSSQTTLKKTSANKQVEVHKSTQQKLSLKFI